MKLNWHNYRLRAYAAIDPSSSKGDLFMRYRHLPFSFGVTFSILSLSCCIFAPVHAQSAEQQKQIDYYRGEGIQPLFGGAQEGDLAPGTYLFPHDIMIEKGKTMTLFPGTKILFTQNAMLVVNGTLICSGTGEAPIVFQRLDNSLYYQPIDERVETRWDGLYLPDSAACRMNNTVISDSKYGIVVSGKDVSMSFDSVRFVNNKFQNVKIGNRMMKIAENSPIVFRYPEQEGVFVEPAAVLNATESIQMKQRERHVTAYPQLRVVMAIAAGAGLASGITGACLVGKYSPLRNDEKHGDTYTTYANAGRIAGTAGGLLFGVGVIGFVWTLFF